MRNREASGISLQEFRTELQMSLLQSGGEGEGREKEKEGKGAGRMVRYSGGTFTEYSWEGL
jgi:hypothetical protein